MKTKKGKLNKIDLYVIFSISVLVAFTVTVLIFSYHDKVVPDTLIEWTFKAFGGELGITGILTFAKKWKNPRSKTKKEVAANE